MDPGDPTDQDNLSGRDKIRERKKRGGCDKEADIKNLLLDSDAKKREQGLAVVDSRYREQIAVHLRLAFPGLASLEITELWEEALGELWILAAERRFERDGSVCGLLKKIVGCDAIDELRRKSRSRFRRLDGDPVVIIRFDSRHDLEDLCTAIVAFCKKGLSKPESVVVRTYVRLVCAGHATATGRLPLALLTARVRKTVEKLARKKHGESEAAKALAKERAEALTAQRVRSLFRSGRRKLREHLLRKGYFHE